MHFSKNLPRVVALIVMLIALALLTLAVTLRDSGLSLAQGPDETEEPDATEEPSGDPSDGTLDPLAERGKYLVLAVAACQDCHLTDGDYSVVSFENMEVELAGGLAFAFEPWGSVVAPNLTVLGEWTDEQIENAIRYGARADGSPLLPPMPYEAYAGMSDDDMAAIIAYLRTLTPVENEIAEAVINEGTREDVRQVPEIDPEAEFPAPDMTDPAAYGHYLGGHVAACIRCHGSLTEDGLLDPDGLLSAEVAVNSEFGPMQFPALIQTRYSDDEMRTLIRDGVKPDGQGVFLMPVYAFHFMTDDDVNVLIAWIRSQQASQ